MREPIGISRAGAGRPGSRCRPSARARGARSARGRREVRGAQQDPLADHRVLGHHAPTRRRQRPVLVEDLVRDRELADVVQQRGVARSARPARRARPSIIATPRGERDDLLGVLVRVVVALLDRGGERLHGGGRAVLRCSCQQGELALDLGVGDRDAALAGALGQQQRAVGVLEQRRRRRAARATPRRRSSRRRRARCSTASRPRSATSARPPRRSRAAAGRTRRRRSGRPGRTARSSPRRRRRRAAAARRRPGGRASSLTRLKSSRSMITQAQRRAGRGGRGRSPRGRAAASRRG